MKALGIVLIVCGALMMIITGVNVVDREKVIDVGPIEVFQEKSHPIAWSPIVGTVLLVAGALTLMAGTDGRKTAL